MKHHHVPQFLLKSWASEVDGKIEVFRLDLAHCPSSRHTPEYTGYEPDLYAITEPPVDGIEPHALEVDHFQNVDDWAARVLQKMEIMGLKDLTEEDHCIWLYFIMLFPWRNPDAISILDIEGPKYLTASLDERPEEYQELAEASDPATLSEWTDINLPGYISNFGKLHLPMLAKHPDLLKNVTSMLWWLYDFSDQDSHLMLADRPCIFTPKLGDRDLLIVLPIGPRRAFMATKSEGIAKTLRQIRPKDLLGGINEMSLKRAKKYIWALDDSPRRFILNRRRHRRSR